jgi:hypothetical protein
MVQRSPSSMREPCQFHFLGLSACFVIENDLERRSYTLPTAFSEQFLPGLLSGR